MGEFGGGRSRGVPTCSNRRVVALTLVALSCAGCEKAVERSAPRGTDDRPSTAQLREPPPRIEPGRYPDELGWFAINRGKLVQIGRGDQRGTYRDPAFTDDFSPPVQFIYRANPTGPSPTDATIERQALARFAIGWREGNTQQTYVAEFDHDPDTSIDLVRGDVLFKRLLDLAATHEKWGPDEDKFVAAEDAKLRQFWRDIVFTEIRDALVLTKGRPDDESIPAVTSQPIPEQPRIFQVVPRGPLPPGYYRISITHGRDRPTNDFWIDKSAAREAASSQFDAWEMVPGEPRAYGASKLRRAARPWVFDGLKSRLGWPRRSRPKQ